MTTTPLNPSHVIEFVAEIVRECSALPHADSLGVYKNSMELQLEEDKTSGRIIWNWGKTAPNEDEEVIGLWFTGKALSDYDGVFSLPREARTLLLANGYDLTEMGYDAQGNEIE